MENHSTQEVLGVDVGAVRIGIARGNILARIAQPLRTVEAAGAIDEIIKLAKRYSSTAIVVGLPRSLDGDETAQTKTVKSWVKAAKKEVKLPFFWQDEALTSQKARSINRPSDNVGLDAQAAAIILQDFLDTNESDRVAV